MKKSVIYLVIAVIAAVMTSCSSDIDEIEIAQDNNNTEVYTEATATRSGEQEETPARVRINMYEMVEGYSVQISNVKIQNIAGTQEVPAFGTNLEGATLSTQSYRPTCDTADGSFAFVKAGTEMQIVITFDATLVPEDGSQAAVTIKGVNVMLNDEAITLEAGTVYDMPVKVNASLLNLTSIDFSAGVQDYEEK